MIFSYIRESIMENDMAISNKHLWRILLLIQCRLPLFLNHTHPVGCSAPGTPDKSHANHAGGNVSSNALHYCSSAQSSRCAMLLPADAVWVCCCPTWSAVRYRPAKWSAMRYWLHWCSRWGDAVIIIDIHKKCQTTLLEIGYASSGSGTFTCR